MCCVAGACVSMALSEQHCCYEWISGINDNSEKCASPGERGAVLPLNTILGTYEHG